MKNILLFEEFINHYDDEYGKHIIYVDGSYKIAVNDIHNATYVSLYHRDKKIGSLSSKNPDIFYPDYLQIDGIIIDKKHRDKGLGTNMYKSLLKYMNPKYRGIYSYLPNAVNKKQIPSIHKKLGGEIIDGDHLIINR